jgi:hypothetical protein
MKKIFLLIALFTVSICGWSQLMTEPFNYTPDATNGLFAQSSGIWSRLNTGDSILVDAGNLTYTGLAASTGNKVKFDGAGADYYRDFTSQTTGSVFSSFILNVSSLGSLGTAGGYFATFIQSGSTTVFGGTIWLRQSTTAGKFNIGISTRSSNAPTSWLATDYTPGTPCFIVFSYDFVSGTVNDVCRLWVNTTSFGGTEPTPDVTSGVPVLPNGADLTSAARFLLRQDNATNTPFIEFDELRVGTTWAQVTPSSAVAPALSATALTAFPATCINTTAGPNSFTITGTDLTTADVTVGALSGYTYSTTAGGTYTSSLSIPHAAGAFSQQVFVKFTPTAVQSYNGNIPVGGGGATAINVAAAGSGINTAVGVTTGAASGVTVNSATLAGSYVAGCSAITAYGIEYSINNNFPNGTGTQAPSTNQVAGSFTSAVGSLAASTTYYYKAYATDATGTVYGTQQSFITGTPAASLSATALTAFGNICTNTTAGPNSFTITGSNLTTANVNVAALSGYTYSTTAGGTYTTTLSLTQPGGSYSQQVFVKFTPTAVQSYNGNINVNGGGAATSIDVAASGAGVNSKPTVVTGASSAVTTVSATLAGSISSIGCSAVTAYGIEYSTTNGFPDGAGTQVPSSNLSGGNFSSNLATLTPNTTYYYKAYATNGGGTAYGTQQSFTTQALTPTLNATALTAFGNICLNTTAGPNSFTINGSALNNTNVTVGALAGFTYSTTAGGTYTTTLSLTQPGGTYTQNIFVKFTPTAVQSYNGNIPVGGGGAATVNVAASGAGVNTTPTVTTGAASAITGISATLAGSIPATGCTAITAYGIEYSTTNGFPNGSGTQVAASNLAGGNFSSAVSGLTPATVYYYKAFATNGGGTSYGAQQTFTTATPVLTATTLTSFGNICLNTTAGPNTFTITGTNLGTANVTVVALTGFTYSTTSGGTYSTTLSLSQPGGSFSQVIYVKFTPTAVQSYNGNIAVGGGNAASINVAAAGSGINTAPSVTTGAASAITQISATLAGSIPSNGCTAVTAYGIEYSTTNGFPNGGGTQVAATNLSGVNFSSAVTGLAPSTTYYYKAYATNGGGTTYGTQQSFTTAAPVLTATALTAFGSVCLNTAAGPNSFTINSNAVTAANISVGPLAGYTFSTTAGGTYTASLSLTHAAGPYTQAIFVMFTPTAAQSYSGNIPVSGGGAPIAINVAASGTGVNTMPAVTTGSATAVTPNSATLSGTINSIGCSNVTEYGFTYSGISGLANGLGTKVPSTNLSGTGFSVNLVNLVENSTYYYKAYATNNGGTVYGTEQSFTTSTIPGGLVIYSNPVRRSGDLHFTLKNVKPDHYFAQIINGAGQLVYQYDIIVPTTFIDAHFQVPGKLAAGVYTLRVGSLDFSVKKTFMVLP